MVRFRSNKDNDDYLMINVKQDIYQLLFSQQLKVPSDVMKEVSDIISSVYSYEKEHHTGYLSDDILLRRDSLLGKYLLENVDSIHISNDDFYISYQKIVNAYLIAVFEGSVKMSNKILPLFKDRVYGTREELTNSFEEVVLDYILNHSDFEQYLSNLNYSLEDVEYYVYENGCFAKQKVKTRTLG